MHLKLLQIGLISFWYNYIEYAITTYRSYTRMSARIDKGALTLIDLQIAFFILFIGQGVAVLLFVAELLFRNRRTTKTTKYIN